MTRFASLEGLQSCQHNFMGSAIYPRQAHNGRMIPHKSKRSFWEISDTAASHGDVCCHTKLRPSACLPDSAICRRSRHACTSELACIVWQGEISESLQALRLPRVYLQTAPCKNEAHCGCLSKEGLCQHRITQRRTAGVW